MSEHKPLHVFAYDGPYKDEKALTVGDYRGAVADNKALYALDINLADHIVVLQWDGDLQRLDIYAWVDKYGGVASWEFSRDYQYDD